MKFWWVFQTTAQNYKIIRVEGITKEGENKHEISCQKLYVNWIFAHYWKLKKMQRTILSKSLNDAELKLYSLDSIKLAKWREP